MKIPSYVFLFLLFFCHTLSAQIPLSLGEKGKFQQHFLNVTLTGVQNGFTAKVEYVSNMTNGAIAWRSISNDKNEPFVFKCDIHLFEYMYQQGWEVIQAVSPNLFMENNDRWESYTPQRYVFKKIGK